MKALEGRGSLTSLRRRQDGDLLAGPRRGGADVGADLLQDRDREALVLLEQREEEVGRRDLGVAAVGGEGNCRLRRLPGT